MVQKTNKNIGLVRNFKKRLDRIIDVDKLIFFGSRAKGTFTRYSDFDLLIVSDKFKNIPWYKRSVNIYLMWKEDFPLELLCYTPEEIKKKKDKAGIVSEAIRTGIEI